MSRLPDVLGAGASSTAPVYWGPNVVMESSRLQSGRVMMHTAQVSEGVVCSTNEAWVARYC